ncbi:MAG: DUF4365 domain-containing protein [Leptospirillum sp.]|jgi:hypothetical protein
MFENIDWSKLNHLQIGRCAEYFVKMNFASAGFEVYSPEVDDHGIDFIVRRPRGQFYEIQVKSLRGLGYIFFPKEKFKLREGLCASIVLFPSNSETNESKKELKFFLIPSLGWKNPNELLVDRDYLGLKSKPEWGLNVSAKNKKLLQNFDFGTMLGSLE